VDTLQDLLDVIIDEGNLDDRREYQPEDLAKMYQLTVAESEDLHYLIQRIFDPSVQRIEDCSSEIVKEAIVESLHSSLDGWDNEHDRTVILRFVDDLTRYAKAAK
jgi:hypothetical protein